MWKFFRMAKTAVAEFVSDGCMSSGAAIAYYSIFALPPLAMLIYLSLGYAGFSNERINKSIKRRLGMPTAAAEITRVGALSGSAPNASGSDTGETSENDQAQQSSPLSALDSIGGIVSLVVLVLTATGLFGELQIALNRAWGVKPDGQGGVRRFLVKRLFSLGLILAMVLLMLLSMLLSALLDSIYANVQEYVPSMLNRASTVVLDNVVTFLIAILLFALIFKVLPDADIRWRDLWVGSILTALLFVIGKALVASYLQRANVGASWGGATTSLIALLAWLYYTSLIVLLGAEFTQVWAREFGFGFRPTAGAQPVAKPSQGAAEKHPS
jgi:membrane protein